MIQHEKSAEINPINLKQQQEFVDCEITELIVSEESINRLMNYREKYQNSCRSSPMYTSKSPNKPWEVVAWYVALN